MRRPHRVTIRESEFPTPGEVHETLARELGFPEYYGYNLDALEDCLGEIGTPTRIVIVRDGSSGEHDAWFDAFEQVVRECAQRSCYVGCTIRTRS